VTVTPEMSRWDRVFKWKPAHMNSIDFLVRATGETRIGSRNSGGTLHGFELMCGYNMVKNAPITVENGMRYLHDPEEREEIINAQKIYEPVPFVPHTYMHENANRLWLPNNKTIEGEKVTDDTIVECQFDVAAGEWRAMRVRDDKTRLYRTTKKISRAANDMSTARNIWMTIHEPVTEAMIRGDKIVIMSEIEAQQAGTEERYYARDIARFHLLSVNMQNFHNQIIKKQLFEKPPVSYRKRLLELACGQAGDMSRWADAQYSVVVGIDVNENNITDPMNGAYARGIRNSQGDNRNPKMCFLIGDCGKSLKTGDAFTKSPESEDLWRALTTSQKPPAYAQDIANAFDKDNRAFDVVSCQFALHYFFESSEILDTFLRNVSDYLRDGGYFITSCMDGDTVHNLFRTNKSSVVTGKVNGNTVWAIQKGYDTYNPETDDAYAKEIQVYLETTRKSIKEYLVPFNVLEKRAAEVGLILVPDSNEFFSATFKRESEKADPKHKRILQQLQKEHIQKQFSNLNRWAVFRKSQTQ